MPKRLLALALLLAAPLFAERAHVAPHPPFSPIEAAPPADVFSAADLTQVRTAHVSLDLEVDFDRYLIRGSATETIVNLTGTRTFVVDTRDLDIESVTIDGKPTTWSLGASSLIGRPLTIAIEPSTYSVRILYATKSNPKSGTLNWLAAATTLGGVSPFLYTFGEPDLTRGWIPIQDTPGVRVTYAARVRVPPGLLAVMSAKNPTETSADGIYDFMMTKPIPPYLIALAVGRMEFHDLGNRTGFYAEPEIVPDAVHDMQYLPEMFDAAQRLLGPYPFDRYDVVLMPPAFRAGGMENPQANFIHVLNCAPGNHDPVTPSLVVAHELAHSWVGDLVTCATWNDTWLNEGFATYFQDRILDEMGLAERAQLGYYFDRQGYEDYVAQTVKSPDAQKMHRSFKKGDTPSVFNTAAYAKGGLFLKMIEDTAGRQAFDGFIREWLTRFRFHWADDRAVLATLRDTIEGADSLQLDTWIYGSGMPSNVTAPRSAAIWDRMTAAATAFASGKSLASLGAKSWTPTERDIFLRTATSYLSAHMADLEATFGMTSMNTPSIHWELAVATSLWAPALPSFERFLMRGGGNVVAVYQTLAKTPAGRTYALDVYKRARPYYDWNTQANVDAVLSYVAATSLWLSVAA